MEVTTLRSRKPNPRLKLYAETHLHSELDLHGDLYTGADNLAISLGRVAVANMQKSPGTKTGK